MKNDATQYEIDNIPTMCTIPWSEFHYHLFSHLIDMADRDLARDIELLIFAESWRPHQHTLRPLPLHVHENRVRRRFR